MSNPSTAPQSFAWQRWVNVGLRTLHLVAVICIGAGLLGAPLSTDLAVLGVGATGLAMFGLDILNKPSHLREVSGLAVLPKLLLVGWMAVDAAARPVLFWLIVAGSVIFAHAPARLRHAVLFGPARAPRPPR